MDFDLLRISLIERGQYDLFADIRPRPTREEWLRLVFSEPIAFLHRREQFHYVPAQEPGIPEPFLVGRIGRRVSVRENDPPEDGLGDTERVSWQAALVIIDPTPHEDGQKVGFEDDPRIGRPPAILDSLAAHLNRSDAPYSFEPYPISDAETFWQFVKNNQGEVTTVTFEFVAPNMFGQADDYDKEMRELRDVEKVRRAKMQIENPDGLELETERVKRAVDYAARGTGSIKAKTRRKRKFNSNTRVKKATVPQIKNEPMSPIDLIRLAISTIFRL